MSLTQSDQSANLVQQKPDTLRCVATFGRSGPVSTGGSTFSLGAVKIRR